MRFTSLFTLFLLAMSTEAAPMHAKLGKDPSVALELLLVGDWIGKPSVGDITFREDGTFKQTPPRPKESVIEGTWKVNWDALPPTLILTGETSTDKNFVKKTIEMQITRLNDKEFQFTADKEDAVSFQRKAK